VIVAHDADTVSMQTDLPFAPVANRKNRACAEVSPVSA
jgi:hypothetical protein